MLNPSKYKGTYAQIMNEALAENDLRKFMTTLGYMTFEITSYAAMIAVLIYL